MSSQVLTPLLTFVGGVAVAFLGYRQGIRTVSSREKVDLQKISDDDHAASRSVAIVELEAATAALSARNQQLEERVVRLELAAEASAARERQCIVELAQIRGELAGSIRQKEAADHAAALLATAAARAADVLAAAAVTLETARRVDADRAAELLAQAAAVTNTVAEQLDDATKGTS